jgi:hypothetical protein
MVWLGLVLAVLCSLTSWGVFGLVGLTWTYYNYDLTLFSTHISDPSAMITFLEAIKTDAHNSFTSVFPQELFDASLLVGYDKKELKKAVKQLDLSEYFELKDFLNIASKSLKKSFVSSASKC